MLLDNSSKPNIFKQCCLTFQEIHVWIHGLQKLYTCISLKLNLLKKLENKILIWSAPSGSDPTRLLSCFQNSLMSGEETEYHSKDFDWEELRQRVEDDPTLRYHLLPFTHQSSSSSALDSQSWNHFHARHSTGKFFKERRYLFKEFPELASCGEHCKVLEAGCGNGSTALPILRGKENVIVYACDCSTEALERATEIIHASNVVLPKSRFRPFCCDFSTRRFPEWLICDSCRETPLKKRNVFLSGG